MLFPLFGFPGIFHSVLMLSPCLPDQHLHRDPLPGSGWDGGHLERQGIPGDAQRALGGGREVFLGDRQSPVRPPARLRRRSREIQPAIHGEELQEVTGHGAPGCGIVGGLGGFGLLGKGGIIPVLLQGASPALGGSMEQLQVSVGSR